MNWKDIEAAKELCDEVAIEKGFFPAVKEYRALVQCDLKTAHMEGLSRGWNLSKAEQEAMK